MGGGMNTDVHLIRQHQHEGGAYRAAAGYAQYESCWLRDGSFIAHAMDRALQHESAAAFHGWAARTIDRYEPHIEHLLARRAQGHGVDTRAFLPARFTVEGALRDDGWPNFQLDGYGQWLWSVAEHLARTDRAELPAAWRSAVVLVARYVAAFWSEPCYDAWEEYRSQLHTSTLASLFGGLHAIAPYLDGDAALLLSASDAIRDVIVSECVADGTFVKHIGNPAVDASLLWVSTPFDVVPSEHPIMRRTVDAIERTLLSEGGVRRYAADTFYGGGAWVLLTAWLGWHLARCGAMDRAKAYLGWVDQQRAADGSLPEQVATSHGNARFRAFWTSRWGEPARPLLWSHAMRIILADAVAAASPEEDDGAARRLR
jgi:GH15 family glucan-1,4-alpha-glucosidase